MLNRSVPRSDTNHLESLKLTNNPFSVNLPSNPYMFTHNNTTLSSSQSMLVCANGVLVRKRDDCPKVSSTAAAASITAPCSMTGAMVNTSGVCANPIPSLASLLSSVSGQIGSS